MYLVLRWDLSDLFVSSGSVFRNAESDFDYTQSSSAFKTSRTRLIPFGEIYIYIYIFSILVLFFSLALLEKVCSDILNSLGGRGGGRIFAEKV